MDHSEIRIAFELTEAEYLAATRLYLFQTRSFTIRVMTVGLLGLICAGLIGLLVSDVMLWATIAFVLLFEFWVFYNMLVQMPRRYFRTDGRLHGIYEMTFSDSGVQLKTAKIESTISWDFYSRVLESRDLYGLVHGKQTRMMSTIPKRAFQSKIQENAFRQLIARHIADFKSMKNVPHETEYTPKSLTPPDWR